MASASLKTEILAPELSKLAKQLRSADKALLTKMRAGLRAAAEPALMKARSNASWSRRIPGAIGISIQFPARGARVRLRVNAKRAPHARAYEGVTTRGGTFRHPVYGNKSNWVSQQARPFLMPAVAGSSRAVRVEMRKVANSIAREAGF